MTDTSETIDPIMLQIAEFVSAALNMPESQQEIASSINTLRQDDHSAIYMVSLESPDIGDAAFLVYRYNLDSASSEDNPGKDHFDTDLQTLITSANLDLPGPRLLAHATTDNYALILATTPETYRALTGQPAEDKVIPLELTQAEQETVRRDAAIGLLVALRDANRHAATWLNALERSGAPVVNDSPGGVAMLEEETALAMHVVDRANVQDMLHALNFFVDWAGRQRTEIAGENDAAGEA